MSYLPTRAGAYCPVKNDHVKGLSIACEWTDRQMDVWTNKWTDGRTDGRTVDGRTDGWTDGWRTDGRMDGRVTGGRTSVPTEPNAQSCSAWIKIILHYIRIHLKRKTLCRHLDHDKFFFLFFIFKNHNAKKKTHFRFQFLAWNES